MKNISVYKFDAARVRLFGSLVTVLAVFLLADILRADQGTKPLLLENESLQTLVDQSNSETDPQERQKINGYLSENAAPKNDQDLQLMDRELKSSDEEHMKRALTWLANTKDPALGGSLVKIMQDHMNDHPPTAALKKASNPEEQKLKDQKEAVLGQLMLKVADLKQTSAIPDIRRYANKDLSENLYPYALTALARLKDETSFGSTRRERLIHRYLDKDDPATRVYLQDAMFNDADLNVRHLAGDAYASYVANPEDERDVQFALSRLVPSKDPDEQDNGFIILERRLMMGHKEKRIVDAAIASVDSVSGISAHAVQLLGLVDSPPELKAAALKSLYGYLNAPIKAHGSAKETVQAAIARQTGIYPHFKGESFCSQHPIFIVGRRFPPVEQKH